MGDGPGYDHMYQTSADTWKYKKDRQRARLASLTMMNQTVGFGENDPEKVLIDKEIVKHLEMAYELLMLIVRK